MAGEMKKMGVIALVMMMLVGMSTATSHTVGDSTGWVVPPSASLYSTWASKQSIKVGDVLVFNFKTGAHTVAEVTKSDYDACTFAKPLSTATNGPANMTVKTSGTHYYVCTVGPHCSLGQKVAVTVASSSSTSSPTASPAASPKSSPTASPAASPKSSPTASPAASPKSSPATSPSPSPSPSSDDDTPAPSPAGSPAATPASDMGPSGSGDTGSSGASSPSSPSSGSSVVEISYGFGFLVLMMSLFFN